MSTCQTRRRADEMAVIAREGIHQGRHLMLLFMLVIVRIDLS